VIGSKFGKSSAAARCIGDLAMEPQNPAEDGKPTAAPSAISRVCFDVAGAAGGDAFEQWHEVCRPVFEVKPLGNLTAYQAAFEFYNVDGLVFNRTQYAATSYHRTSRHVSSGGSEFFTLQLLLRGRETGESNGNALLMAPDRIVLRDWSRPHHSFSEAAEQISVIIPRDRIDARDRLRSREPAASWTLHSPQGMMLANALMSIWRGLPHANIADAPALSSGLLGLINGLLSSHPAPTESKRMQQASLAAMQTYLSQRLWNADLDADHLLRAFHQSRSTIYRMFRESGGVRAFIQEQRLAEILRELSRGENRSLSVAEVARKWGFSDVGYFHRAFKKRFGLTPGDVSRSANHPERSGPHASPRSCDRSTTTLHQWVGVSH
jgi:AraC-like DNA-binding protein